MGGAVAHVELSLSKASLLDADTAEQHPALVRWAATVRDAAEPCLVIDHAAVIVATSVSCSTLLGLGHPASASGRFLLDGALRLVDFTAAQGALTEAEIDKIPPLLALSSGRLARGLIRVRCGVHKTQHATVDAIATPLIEKGKPIGSLTFFSAV
jgi:hypothetical protein